MLRAVLMWKYRLLYGSESSEPEQFLKDYEKVLDYHKKLKQTDAALKKWDKDARALARTASEFAAALGGDPQAVSSQRQEMEILVGESIEKAIQKKIGLLKEIELRRHRLESMRLDRDHCKRALDGFRKGEEKARESGKPTKPEVGVVLEKFYEDSVAVYEHELRDLSSAIEFILKEAETHDGLGLIWNELQAFNSMQFQFFLHCQKITMLRGDNDLQEFESNWKTFSKGMTNIAKSGQATDKTSPKQPKPKTLPTALTTPPPLLVPTVSTATKSNQEGDVQRDEESKEDDGHVTLRVTVNDEANGNLQAALEKISKKSHSQEE